MKMALECVDKDPDEVVVEDSLSGSLSDSNLRSFQVEYKTFIWKYFGFEPNKTGNPQSKDHPKCRLYQVEIAIKDGNTSNLYSHIKNEHPEKYDIVQRAATNTNRKRQSEKIVKTQQPSLEATWNKTKLFSYEYKKLTKLVTYCLAKDMLPISTVDKPGFKAML